MKKGFLISIEGIDGSGKSSLIHPVAKVLKEDGLDVVVTQEPGGTTLGRGLRQLLHEEKKHICDKAEFLLFASDRVQHFEEVVTPSLKEGKIVISDRMGDSSLAYQGYGRGLDLEIVKKVNDWAMNKIEPDLVFYIKLDLQTAINRIMLRGGKLTSFETEEELFWQRVINGYDTIFKNRDNVILLDGNLNTEELTKQTVKEITKHIGQ
jgi:dTMP kinase